MAICSIESCYNIHWSKGLCSAHYQRQRLGRDLLPPIRHITQGQDRQRNPLYATWRRMRQRCYNPNHKYYEYYGGRGIKVCNRWQGPEGFTSFCEDMGRRPKGLTLDRRDNNKGYSPENCRWATRTTQQINQRLRKDNTSKVKGVHWFKNAKLWSVYIDYNGKRKNIGYFKDKQNAINARKAAELDRLLNNVR